MHVTFFLKSMHLKRSMVKVKYSVKRSKTPAGSERRIQIAEFPKMRASNFQFSKERPDAGWGGGLMLGGGLGKVRLG